MRRIVLVGAHEALVGRDNYIFGPRGNLKVFMFIFVETSNRGGNVTPLHRLTEGMAVHA